MHTRIVLAIIALCSASAVRAATFNVSGTTLEIDLAANETCAITAGAANYSFALTGGTWTGTDGADATGNGTATLSALKASFTAVTVTDSVTGVNVIFNDSGANTYGSSFTVMLDDPAAGSITFNGNTAFSGSAALSASTSKNIVVASGAVVSVVNGSLSLSANQQLTPTAGAFRGIDVNGGTLTTSGSGAIALSGKGGDSGSSNHGINLRSGGKVTSTASSAGAGTITLTGIGRGTAANSGVEVAGSGSSIASVSGNILITGSSFGTADGNTGFYLNTAATVTSTGTGAAAASITINATAGNGTSNNAGFTMFGLSTTNGISAVDGDITITGQGRGQGTLTDGIRVQDRSFIRTTGDGNISLVGTASPDGGAGPGIWVTNAGGSGAFVEALGTGSVTMTGSGTGTGVNADIYLNGSTVGNASSAAAITLNANTLTVDATSNLLGSATGSITIQPRTAGRDILIGADDTASALGLTGSELARINVGNVTLGSVATNSITLGASVTLPLTTTVNLVASTINLGGNTITAGTVRQTVAGQPDISVSSLAGVYGSVAQGSTRDLVFTLGNGGFVDLTGISASLTSATPGEFSVFAAPSASLAAGGSTTFTIRFSPSSFGQKSASLQIASDDPDENPTVISLSGFGASSSPLNGIKSVGPTGFYSSVTQATLDIQGVGINGPLVLELQPSYDSTVETFPLVLSNLATTATNTLTIRPASGATALSLSSADTSAATVDLNGAQYVIFDGRPGGVGTAKELTIANTSTSGVAVRLINEASNNTLKHLTLQGVNTSASSGTVVFSTTTGPNGNDNNTLDTCDLRDGASTPVNGLYSLGSTTTTAQNNSSNTVSNCNFYNFYSSTSGLDAFGLRLEGGSTEWTITGNSFYQTATRAAAANSSGGIRIASGGNNFTITGNFIGGDSPRAVATTQKWTTTGTTVASQFQGIRLAVGTTTPSSVQGNTIANIVWTSNVNSSNHPGVWTGIYVTAGSVNIGTVTGNTIGSGTGTDSISTTTSGSGGTTLGLVAAGSGTRVISNNTIGSITTNATATTLSASLVGIWVPSGTTTVSNNTIGSTTTANSLNAATASTASTQYIIGISSSSGNATITGNTLANFNNNYNPTAGAGYIQGIISSGGGVNLTGNTVRNFTTTSGSNAATTTASLVGIVSTGTGSPVTIAQNVVHSLTNTSASAAVNVTGIYYAGPTSGTNLIARNFVHSLAVSSSSATSAVQGILIAAGSFTAQNNVVRVGLKADGTSTAERSNVRGIHDNGTTAGRNYYHNSVYLGGTQVAGSANTFAFISTGVSNTRNYRNNLFVNARSNSGATGKHYAVMYGGTTANPTGLTANNNLFFASGTGGVLGFFNSADRTTLAAWQTATGHDANSLNADPLFVNPTGTAATVDLHLPATSPAKAAGTALAVTNDFDGDLRNPTAPTIGADEVVATGVTLTLSPGSPVGPSTALTATFADAVDSNTPLSYQLFVNEVAVAPAGPDTLIHFTGPAAYGVYTLKGVVTNSVGSSAVLTQSFTVANAQPTFAGYAVSTKQNTAISLGKAKLLARASDPDGGTLSISAVSPASAQGGTVTLGANSVTYTPANNFTGLDTFTLTIADGQGGSVLGTVTVNVTAGTASGGNQASQITLQPGGGVSVLFFGIPGQSYQIQRSTDLTTWTPLQNVTAGADGTVPFTDPNPPPGSAFYRTVVP